MLSNYAANKLQDWFYRAQTFTLPANFFIALCTTNSSPSAMGTEVTGGDYARTAIARSLTNFSGTQGVGTTTVSSGTNGTVFNNAEIALGTPTAAWGDVTCVCLMDQLVGGNVLEYYNLPVVKHIVNIGDPVTLPLGTFQSALTSS